MSFAEKLRASRKEKGLSQEALAEKLKVSRQSVTKWESGLAYPEIRTLILLAETLDRDLDWLLSDEKNQVMNRASYGEQEPYYIKEKIPDRKALKSVLEKNVILRILHALDRLEICEETEQETGRVRYSIYDGMVFVEMEENVPETGMTNRIFTEMKFQDMQQFLPWLEKALKTLFIQSE